jgi:BON domain
MTVVASCLLAGCQAQSQAPLIVPVTRKDPPVRAQRIETRQAGSRQLALVNDQEAPPRPGPEHPGSPASKLAAKSAVDSDAALEQAIRQRFAKSKIGADGFEVRVDGGTAYISGKTNVLQHKGTATRMAKTAGATRVVNRVEVDPEARKAAADRLQKARQTEARKGSKQRRDER